MLLLYTRGFSRFVTATTALIATGWNESCRAKFMPLHEASRDYLKNKLYSDAEGVILYYHTAMPIVVQCEWSYGINQDGTILVQLVILLMLEREVPDWKNASYAESREAMRGQFRRILAFWLFQFHVNTSLSY
ncbi:hypothetical protein EAE93_03845 [Photorhabdus akhurstii]|nr:hypothetical protein [Photorhabdus akhurstii]